MRIKRLYLLFLLGVFVVSAQEDIIEIGQLPNALTESSGLLFYNGKLITHNDSGNEALLHEIDTVSLAITRTIRIANATNVDWEDITQDENYIYIGDFGNFNGDRQDLVIYRILKTAYDANTSVMADRIDFSYQDQTNFDRAPNSNWDAEALFHYNDQLVLLTKQWQGNGTVVYSIPKLPGNHIAQPMEEYDSRGLVTGATFDPLGETLFLIGYTSLLQGFLIEVKGLTTTSIFGGTTERTNLNLGTIQVEALAAIGDGRYFFSSEFFSNSNFNITSPSRLFAFNAILEIEMPPENEEEQFLIFTSPNSQTLEYELQTTSEILGRAIFDSSGKMVEFALPNQITANTIAISALSTGIYYLTFYLRSGIISKGFARY
ncbi:T9SS type A sorting domain-containing protein [Spongiimicrobium salis]|uniref:T9SS type A sorting domain-containing protein n=1 Tax=Spongiimicrobium salis TaxID=1667022 RepID=UPI00374D0531